MKNKYYSKKQPVILRSKGTQLATIYKNTKIASPEIHVLSLLPWGNWWKNRRNPN